MMKFPRYGNPNVPQGTHGKHGKKKQIDDSPLQNLVGGK